MKRNTLRSSECRSVARSQKVVFVEMPSTKPKNYNQRFNMMKEKALQLVNIGSMVTGEVFEQRMKVLEAITSAWSKNIEISDSDMVEMKQAVPEQTSFLEKISMPTGVVTRGRPAGIEKCHTMTPKRKTRTNSKI